VRALHLRGCLAAFVALAFLCAQVARADGTDGGPPPDAAVTDAAIAGGDAAAPAPAPVPGELATPPDLATPATSATVVATPLVDTAAPAQTEPPRPITRRLWFWMAVAGVIIAGVAIGIAVRNPSVSRPDCPNGYVCPL